MRIILSRSLGSEALGVYQIALSFFGVLCTIVASGIPVAISHISAKCGVNKNYTKESKYISSGLIVGCTTALILSVGIILFKNVIIKFSNETSYYVLLILIPSIFATTIYSCFRGALWGREKHTANCIAELGEQSIRLVLFIILLSNVTNTTKATYLAGLSLCISNFVSMFISIFFFKRYGGRLSNPKYEFGNFVKTSSTITLTRVATSLIQPLISIILPSRLVAAGYSMETAMSMFGISLGMTFPLLALPSTICGSFVTAIIPEISSLVETKNYEEFNNKIKLSISITLFATFCFVPLFLGLGKEVGLFLFDNTTSGYLLVISTWTMIPSCLCMVSTSILNILNMEKQGFLTYLAGAIVLFLCVWFLPQFYGIYSVIIGMGCCFSITCVLNMILIGKKTKIGYFVFKPLILMSFFASCCAMLASQLFGIFKYVIPLFFNLCFSGGICSVCFVVLCLMFNLVDIKQLFKDINIVKHLKIKKKRKIWLLFKK